MNKVQHRHAQSRRSQPVSGPGQRQPTPLTIELARKLPLAEFYSAVLGQPVTYSSDDFCVVAQHNRASGLGFQRAPDHRAPTWPSPESGQQIHLDVMVEDLLVAHDAVTRLGAQPLGAHGIYADPAGHPFCLVKRPEWAPPLSSD